MDKNYKKVLMFLDWLSLVIKQFEIFLELKWFIDHKESYTKLVNKKCVGMGKTYSLILLALKYNLTIVVPCEIAETILLDSVIVNQKLNTPTTKTYKQLMEEESTYDILLFDTGFSNEEIDNIYKKCNIGIGYRELAV